MTEYPTGSGIIGFFGKNRWLSNFHLCAVNMSGITYTSSEAAYQAMKTTCPKARKQLASMSPAEAKKFGKTVKLRANWERHKLDYMRIVVGAKFTQNENLREKLIATHPLLLVEENHWGDTFWGVYAGKGENNLGKILMEVREKLGEKK